MVNIAVFASGNGTNAENLITHFSTSTLAKVTKVYSNKPDAYVINRAIKHQVAQQVISNKDLSSGHFLKTLQEFDLIVLAGFLAKIPEPFVNEFEHRIVNIHPSLLPKYGGKGMYGGHVHQAVIDAQESHSGITIHLVNKNYDEGRILFQAMCEVAKGDNVESLAGRIHQLEKKYFPKIVEDYIVDKLI